MPATTSVDASPPGLRDRDWDVAEVAGRGFATPDLVGSAAALFTPLRKWDGREGGRHRLIVGPGLFAVSRQDPAKADRQVEREHGRRKARTVLAATDMLLETRLEDADGVLEAVTAAAVGGLVPWSEVDVAGAWSDHLARRIERRDQDDEEPGPARITGWSRKSRARMVRTLIALDYGPMLAQEGRRAMVTLTYPGGHLDGCEVDGCAGCGWLLTAPTAQACKRHVDAFKKRFERAWGRPLVGTWKREFQRRGAPHYHLLMTVPRGEVDGEDFLAWSSRVWSEVVNERRPEHRAAHRRLGVDVSFDEGTRMTDPRRLAVYFSKHGSFAAKDYQNDAPAEWVEAGSVGRFWGRWGLDLGTAEVEVTPVEALAAARTMRRWQRANGFRVQREVWRTNTRTGVQRKRRSGVWVGARMRGHLGFVAVNDGPAFASALAVLLDQARESAQAAELARLGIVDETATPPRRSTFVAGAGVQESWVGLANPLLRRSSVARDRSPARVS